MSSHAEDASATDRTNGEWVISMAIRSLIVQKLRVYASSLCNVPAKPNSAR